MLRNWTEPTELHFNINEITVLVPIVSNISKNINTRTGNIQVFLIVLCLNYVNMCEGMYVYTQNSYSIYFMNTKNNYEKISWIWTWWLNISRAVSALVYFLFTWLIKYVLNDRVALISIRVYYHKIFLHANKNLYLFQCHTFSKVECKCKT